MRAGHFRKYGFGYILLALWIVTTAAYYNQHWAEERSQLRTQCEVARWSDPSLDPEGCPMVKAADVRTSFYDGLWENMESEFGQLFFQFLGMVAFARYVAYKQEQDFDELKSMLSRALEQR